MKIFLVSLLFVVYNCKITCYNSTNCALIQNDPFPYTMKRQSAFAILPDSLGGKGTHGFAVIQLTLDDAVHIKSVKVLKLKIGGKKQIDYWFQEKMTKQVARYFPFLNEYAEKQKIVRNKFYYQNSEENPISFIVRF